MLDYSSLYDVCVVCVICEYFGQTLLEGCVLVYVMLFESRVDSQVLPAVKHLKTMTTTKQTTTATNNDKSASPLVEEYYF